MISPVNDSVAQHERAVLVGVIMDGRRIDDSTLEELSELARSAGAEVVGRVVQKRRSLEAATAVGKGKLEEVRQMCDAYAADLVIFEIDLSPSQIREIEKAVGRRVIDRSELILDIFASRARTHESKLQVELAQLEYTAPRLRGMWTHLERIAGAGGATGAGAVGAIGTRGPGEKQIEIDRRLVDRRVALLKEQLAEIDRRKVREVRARKEHFNISLVGYTNAGKSTLMNALTGANTHAADRLFETLDTLTRRWDLGGGRHVLLSDTVGFIRDLPHHLVASFRATLEEAIHADLLLHVVDISSPEAEEQIAAVDGVLEQLGLKDRPTVLVLNKIDLPHDEALAATLRVKAPLVCSVAAKQGYGIAELTEIVAGRTRQDMQRVTLSLPVADGRSRQFLGRYSEIFDERYEEDRVILDLQISLRALEHLHTLSRDIRHVTA